MKNDSVDVSHACLDTFFFTLVFVGTAWMPPLKIWSLLVGCVFFLELLFDIWGFPLETVFHQSPCGIGVHDWHHMDFPSTRELNLVFLILHEYISCCFLPKLIFYAFSTLNSYFCLWNNDFHAQIRFVYLEKRSNGSLI